MIPHILKKHLLRKQTNENIRLGGGGGNTCFSLTFFHMFDIWNVMLNEEIVHFTLKKRGDPKKSGKKELMINKCLSFTFPLW